MVCALPEELVGKEVAITMLDCGVKAVALSYPVGLMLIVGGGEEAAELVMSA